MAVSRRPRGSGPASGFTMIELMVVVVVLSVLLTVAVPSFDAAMNANRLAGASNELMASLQTARMEAVKRNARVGLCLSKDSNSTAPVCSTDDIDGWIVFTDVNKNDKFDSGDTLLRTSTLPSPKVVVTASATPGAAGGAIVFRGDGFARKDKASPDLLYGTIDACIPTKRPPENVRHVIIAAGSRASIVSANGAAKCETPDDKPDEP